MDDPLRTTSSHMSRRAIMARYFNLCAPVGHAGVPLPQDLYSGNQNKLCCSADGKAFRDVILTGKKDDQEQASDVILNLPIEIKTLITSHLSQHDLVNLARVSRSFYDAAMFSLYENVVIDSDYSFLNDPLRDTGEKVTFIKTRYNLKKFMQLIRENSDTPFPMGMLVRSFKVINLPDGISRNEVRSFIYDSIPNLTRLSSFYWKTNSSVLPLSLLDVLPNKEEITTLAFNVDLGKTTSFTSNAFPSLTKISLAPFVNSQNLSAFFESILLSEGETIEKLETLQLASELPSVLHKPSGNVSSAQCLVITKYMMDNNLQQPNTSESDRFIVYNQIDCGFWSFLNAIAKKGKRFESLKILDIHSANFLSTDSNEVCNIVNLKNLRTLCLSNINEIQFLPDVDYEVHDVSNLALRYMKPSFLEGLLPNLRQLTKLKLDYRESMKDTVCEFIGALQTKANISLRELDIVIHWDDSKEAVWSSWETLAERYIAAILLHKKTLRKLSLIATEDSKFYELHKTIPANMLRSLKDCRHLQSLRLHGESLHPSGHLLLSEFPDLHYLDLVGKEAGGPPHMGLQVVHDGVLDNWYRVIHVAITLAQGNPSLKFVRVDKCLFECGRSGNVSPKLDNLKNWFEKKTRVVVSADDF